MKQRQPTIIDNRLLTEPILITLKKRPQTNTRLQPSPIPFIDNLTDYDALSIKANEPEQIAIIR